MDIAAVFTGLAQAAAAIGGLNTLDYTPDSIPEPCFYPSSVDGTFDVTGGRGHDELVVTCLLLVSRADDRSAQQLMKAYLSGGGPTSVKVALEASRRTGAVLGGACHDLRVERFQGYRWYTHAGTEYLGAEFVVRVIGSGG